MSVKIVGAVSDESSLEEIESIAKVFAYEQRMKLYASPLRSQASQHATQHAPKPVQQPVTVKPLHCSPVKGLC